MKLKVPHASLTAHQRMVLYLKANERDDEQDRQRIIAASSENQNDSPDFYPDLNALYVTHLFHCAQQLDLLVQFLDLYTSAAEDQLLGLWACVVARHYVMNQEAWLSIGEEVGLGREVMLTGMNGSFRTLGNELTDRILRIWALSDDDYKWFFDRFAETEMPLPEMPTVEKHKREYEGVIAQHRKLFGGF